jgi:single-strand DNA-binding protein
MNYVNLVGKMSSNPKVLELQDGKKIAQFTMSTKEPYLDKDGNSKFRKNWHRVTAWGRWVQVLEVLGQEGIGLAIEGRLVSRFYNQGGERKHHTEVEINDLVIL